MDKEQSLLFKTLIIGLVAGFVGAYLFLSYGQSLLRVSEGDNKDNVVTILQDDQNKVIRVTEESLTIDIAEEVSDAVVSINIRKDISRRSSSLFDEFFFFTPPEDNQDVEPDIQIVGGGSGFIISPDGYILTNKHVIDDKEATFSVVLSDGRELDAEIIGEDLFLDIAVLKIEASDLPVIRLGNSDDLRIGQTVVAIGNALAEFSNTVTKGVVSGIGRSIVASGSGSSERLDNVIQTDAAINPGNSGGPLLNLAGEVVGVNTAVSIAGQSIGFAIPINDVKVIIDGVIAEGEIIRPYLGVRYVILTEDIIEDNDLNTSHGALIVGSTDDPAILEDSPASKAGLQENDVILTVDGVEVNQETTLAEIISSKSPGQVVNLTILRDGQERDITVTLERYQTSD